MPEMPKKLWENVEEWRKKGFDLSDQEVSKVYEFCFIKMRFANIENPDDYIFLLFPTELKDYLFRQSIKATSYLNQIREEEDDVFDMYAESKSSKVS